MALSVLFRSLIVAFTWRACLGQESCSLSCEECPFCLSEATCAANPVPLPPKSDYWPPEDILQRIYGPSPTDGPFLDKELEWFETTVLSVLPSLTQQSDTEYALTKTEVKLVKMGLSEWLSERAAGTYSCEEIAIALTKRATYLQEVQKMNHFMYWGSFDWINVVLDQAKALDAKAESEGIESIAPLYCYPVPIKGTMATMDFPSSLGFAALHDMLALKDADMVSLVKNANGVLFGKTNVPELAHSWGTGNYANGICFNPWDYDMLSGGSSGGSGGAVASYTATVALTEDTLGSTNVPATRNHVFGYDPPKFHYPNSGNPSLTTRNDQIGLNALSIDDIIAFDKAVLMTDEAHALAEAYVAGLDNSEIIIGCSDVYYDYEGVTDAIKAKYDEAVMVLKEAGFTVLEDDCQTENPYETVPDPPEVGSSSSVWYAELATFMSDMLGSDMNPWEVMLNGFYDFGTTLSSDWMYNYLNEGCDLINDDTDEMREQYLGPVPAGRSDAYNKYFDEKKVDLLIGPTQVCDRVLWTEDMGANGGCDGGNLEQSFACAFFCHTAGVIGSFDKTFTKAKFIVPVGLTEIGEPFSIQFMSRAGPRNPTVPASEWVYDEEGPAEWNLEELYMVKRLSDALADGGLGRADATINYVDGLISSDPVSTGISSCPSWCVIIVDLIFLVISRSAFEVMSN